MRPSTSVNTPAVYELRPPEWLPKSHSAAELGYIGFDPPRPGQEEEILLPRYVKDGYQVKTAVPAEGFSAQEVVNEALSKDDEMTALEDLMSMVLARRASEVPAIPASSFRLPSRVTLNDAKRQAWFKDLADPEVPLYKLGKTIPHGLKGVELLDFLHAHAVAVPRAVWFLRVFGANETTTLRKQPSYNPTQYSVDWANVMTTYIKKQLVEIALPTAPRVGFSIKQTFKSVLADSETRERWTARFTYCVNLLRGFYEDGLVDRRTCLAWLIQQLSSCNLAQAGFVVRLADEYFEDITSCRALCYPCVEALASKLSDVRAQGLPELSFLEDMTVSLLRRALISHSDVYVSPRIWTSYPDIFQIAFGLDGDTPTEGDTSSDLHAALSPFLDDVESRVTSLLFLDEPVREMTDLASAVMDVQHLNSLNPSTDLLVSAIRIFGDKLDSSATFARKLDSLISWGVCPSQHGSFRPYVVVALLDRWRTVVEERANRKDTVPPYEFLHDHLFDWLDQSHLALDEQETVANLFGKLAKRELFMYSAYVQRLIARGEPGLSISSADPPSRHQGLLRLIPVESSQPAMVLQRKVVLYGPRVRESPEERVEKDLRRELRAALPQLYGGDHPVLWSNMTSFWDACPIFVSAKQYELTRTVGQWLTPIVCKRLADYQSIPLDAPSCVVVMSIVEQLQCHESVIEICICMLRHTELPESLVVALEVLRRYMTTCYCSSMMDKVVAAALDAQQRWRARGLQLRALLRFLEYLNKLGLLSAVDQHHLASDSAGLRQALLPTVDMGVIVPDSLTEILMFSQDPSQNAPSLLANTLWYKFRSSTDWAWKVWDNTIASLRQVPIMMNETTDRRLCAHRYVSLLASVDSHLVNGLDADVFAWFIGRGKREVEVLTEEVWDLVTLLIVKLCATGILEIGTVLRGLVYPTWRFTLSTSSSDSTSGINITRLRAVTTIFKTLLLDELDGSSDAISFMNVVEHYRLRCHREEAFRTAPITELLCETYSLVMLEGDESLEEDVRETLGCMWRAVYGSPLFQQALYRGLDDVREALKCCTIPGAQSGDGMEVEVGDICPRLDVALQTCLNASVLNDAKDDDSSSAPWMLAIRGLAMQLAIAQASQSVPEGDATSNEALDTLLSKLVHPRITAEEVSFVADLAKNVNVAVAKKIIDLGLTCISDLLIDSLSESSTPEMDSLATSGEILHLLAAVLQPICEDSQTLPAVDLSVQNKFIGAFMPIFAQVSATTLSRPTSPETLDTMLFLTRLLQFNLGLPDAWTIQMQTHGLELSTTVFKLIVHFSSSASCDPVAFSMLMDTFYFIVDELTALTAHGDLFKYYPQIPISELTRTMSSTYRDKIRLLLPFTPVSRAVASLSYATRDPTNGSLTPSHPVQNRPWEWTEHLGDPPLGDGLDPDHLKEESGQMPGRRALKNSGALSLELFDARATGDSVSNTKLDGRARATLHTFEDGLDGDMLFQRAWRESRLEVVDSPSTRPRVEDGEAGGVITPGIPRGPASRPGSRGASPSASTASRSSSWQYAALGHTALPSAPPSGGGSFRPSPAQLFGASTASRASVSTSASGDELPQVGGSARRASKRKATTEAEDDVQMSDAAATAAGKKTKGKTSGKTRAKR